MSMAISVGLLACSSDHTITAPAPNIPRAALVQVLTPDVAAAVGSDGKLQLADPPSTGRAQISAARAGALAVGLAKYNLPYNSAMFDGQHGGPIAYQKLAVCGPPRYAAAAFQRLPMDDPTAAALPMQKALGPWWLVTLCGPAGDPQLSVGVSAYSTDLSIDARGAIVFPAIGGDDFVPEGIPAGHELPAPEAAVMLVARLSGRRVAALPELVAPFYKEDSPLGARWHLQLDGPAHVQTADGRTLEASDVYVSRVPDRWRPGSQTWNADTNQPASVQVTLIPQMRVGENYDAYLKRQLAETQVITVARRPEVPITFTSGGIAP